jgi:hypothetical protein
MNPAARQSRCLDRISDLLDARFPDVSQADRDFAIGVISEALEEMTFSIRNKRPPVEALPERESLDVTAASLATFQPIFDGLFRRVG